MNSGNDTTCTNSPGTTREKRPLSQNLGQRKTLVRMLGERMWFLCDCN
jgi:hypothetical protein